MEDEGVQELQQTRDEEEGRDTGITSDVREVGNGTNSSRFPQATQFSAMEDLVYAEQHFFPAWNRKKFEPYYTLAGLASRIHGNTGKTPSHALVLKDMRAIIKFVTQCEELMPFCCQAEFRV